MNTFQVRFRRLVQLAIAMALVSAVFSLIPSVKLYDMYTRQLIGTYAPVSVGEVVLMLAAFVPGVVVYRQPRRAHTWMWLLWIMLMLFLTQWTDKTLPGFASGELLWPIYVAYWARRLSFLLFGLTLVVAIISRDKKPAPIAPAKVV